MALAVAASGTKTTDGTEQTLATDTNGKTYVLSLDLSSMANGNTLAVRLKTKVLTGGSSRVAYLAYYVNAQSQPNVYSVPVPAFWSLVATIELTAGSNINVPWELLTVD